jgi:acetyl esterase
MNTAPRSDGGGAFADSAEPQPHRQVLAYLARSLPSPDPWSVDIETLRRDARARVLDVRGELEPVSSVEAIDVRGVASRLYRPRGDEDEVLIWAHGGGWMHGDLDGCEDVARALANRADCAVLTVGYRLAPENPYPAGFNDLWAVTEWARGRFADVAVGGDSSGGNLSAAVALKARDCGLDLRAQLLVYPVLDSIEDTDFKIRFRERYATFAGQEGFGTTTFERLKHIWDSYVPDTGRRMSPYLSPLHAPSLRGVAPVILITAEHDFLRGEAEDYARRLSNEGVPAQLHNYRGQIHGFFEMRGVLADADDAIDTAAEALRRSFPDRSAK